MMLSVFTSLQSQTGVITGKIFDEESGESLMFCNIIIEGENISAAASSDLDGVFRFDGLPAGTYSMKATYVSYSDKTVTDIEVNEGGVTVIDIPMSTSSQTLQEIVVTSKALRNNLINYYLNDGNTQSICIRCSSFTVFYTIVQHDSLIL